MPIISKIHNSINIIFIRDEDVKTTDDSLTIKPTETANIFSACYKDVVNKSKHDVYMSGESLRNYILSLFHIVCYDAMPFKSVQINFPLFPCIIINMKDIDENLRFRLQSMVDFTLKTSFANADEDDDMPPLESVPTNNECECDCN